MPTSGALGEAGVDMEEGACCKRVFYRPLTTAASPMDRKLLDILACPATRQPLAMLEARGLQALNEAVNAGRVTRIDGSPQADPLREALVTRDRKRVYRIDDGIPVLLVEESIATGQVADFPAG